MGKKNYLDDILARQQYMDQNVSRKDPFDKGIMRAVKSAKQSLAMDEDQEDRALRNSMLTFGEAVGQMPKAKGFMANFAQAGKALSPALRTHDQFEDLAKNENMQAFEQARKIREAEDARAANLEQQAYMREMGDRQHALQQEALAEKRNYHDQAIAAGEAKARAKADMNNLGILHNVDEHGLVEGKYVPFTKAKDRDPYNKKLMGANLVKTHLLDAIKTLGKFDKDYEGKLVNAPLVGSSIGKAKGIIGHFANSDEYKKEGLDRADLDQAIGTIATKFEKELKGAVLTGDIIERFAKMGIVPLAHDSPYTIKGKLDRMLKTVEEEKNIAEKSLTNNYHYSPDANARVADHVMGDPTALTHNIPSSDVRSKSKPMANEYVTMIDPETGEKQSVYFKDVNTALKLGLAEVN